MMVLIVLGLAAVILIQLSQISKDQKTSQPTQTNVESKNEASRKLRKTTADIKSQTDKIQKYLVAEAALLGVSDNLSLYFEDGKNSDENVSLDSSKSWIPASTIKSYVLLEAFRQKRLRLINFDHKVTIQAQNVVPAELETDEFPRLREGTEVTIRQLVEAMIIQSDNTAYNTLLDILDRRNINSSLRNIGITETVVGEKLNLDASQFQTDLQVPGRQSNTTTAKDLATYFSLLYSQKIPDSEEMLGIFKRQKINNMIPARLPENTVVAHKTGDWSPIYHDGGIVYKPDDPFIFVAFTNSGDPAVVAKLAQVAYYQDAKYVGRNVAVTLPVRKNLAFAERPVYSNQPDEQVLGESTPNKFPDVTAEDLGITSSDLVPDLRQINKVASARITPGSFLYKLKKILEKGQLTLSFSNGQKVKAYLSLANNRLSEIKSLLSYGDVSKNDELLTEGLEDIKNATNLAKNDPQSDVLLIEIKKTHDLYYAVMEQKASNLPDDKKESFVDSVYNFYQKSRQQISPAINSSVIVSPTQQKPTIGTVEKVTNSQMTLKFDDGSIEQVNLSTGTNVRSVNQETSEDLSAIKPGTKVAVVGPAGADNTINAQFILNNIPQGLTDQHKGTVIEVNHNTGVIKMIDQKGQVNLVRVDDNTAVKSKDTDVSLEGIKAGSQVVIFGTSPQTAAIPSDKSLKPNFPSSSANLNQGKLDKQINYAPSPYQNSKQPMIEIKATSVTVIGNSSGKNEQQSSANSHSSGALKPNSADQPSSNQNNVSSNKKGTDKKDSKK